MLSNQAKNLGIHPSQRKEWKKVDPDKLPYNERMTFARALEIENPENMIGEALIEAIKEKQKKLK